MDSAKSDRRAGNTTTLLYGEVEASNDRTLVWVTFEELAVAAAQPSLVLRHHLRDQLGLKSIPTTTCFR